MKYRQIKTDFWDDGYVLELSPREKLFFIYLFTNSKVNLCGIYELPDRTICYTLGATLGELSRFKKKFESDNKFVFHKGWIYIVNFASHNLYSSARAVVSSFISEFNNVPSEVKDYLFNKLKIKYEIPIKDSVKVMVMDKVMDKYGRATLGIEARPLEERVNPEEIPL